MSKKKTKKNKPYYKTKSVNNNIEKKNEEKSMANNRAFIIGIGFLILFYGYYYVKDFYISRIVVIAGLCVMMYSTYKSIKFDKENDDGGKNLKIDYVLTAIIGLAILYNIAVLIFSFLK